MSQGQTSVIIYVTFVERESPMPHAKFQDHKTLGSRHDNFKGFYHQWPS